MNEDEKLRKVGQAVYFFMTGVFDTTGVNSGLPVIDSPYVTLIPDYLTHDDGAMFKDFDAYYHAQIRIIDEVNRLEGRGEDDYEEDCEEINDLLYMSESLTEIASIEAFIDGYHGVNKIKGERNPVLQYEDILKKQFSRPNDTEIFSYDYLCDCFTAVQERLCRSGAESKENPDLHLMKLAFDEMLRFSTAKAHFYGLLAGQGKLPLWYDDGQYMAVQEQNSSHMC